MNIFLWIARIVVLFLPLISQRQIAPDSQAHYYQAAYRHILSSPEFKSEKYYKSCITVFDSIVFQDQITFNEVFGRRWHYTNYQQKNRLIDSLTTVDNATRHKPHYSASTAALTKTSAAKKNCTVILFSRLTSNWLMAEVSQNKYGSNAARDIMPDFGITLRYLIFFRPDGKIERSYTQVVNYN